MLDRSEPPDETNDPDETEAPHVTKQDAGTAVDEIDLLDNALDWWGALSGRGPGNA